MFFCKNTITDKSNNLYFIVCTYEYGLSYNRKQALNASTHTIYMFFWRVDFKDKAWHVSAMVRCHILKCTAILCIFAQPEHENSASTL
jgi:hypothetical protein